LLAELSAGLIKMTKNILDKLKIIYLWDMYKFIISKQITIIYYYLTAIEVGFLKLFGGL